jgi:transcriptional regulator with XRE-family HTH domain
MLSELIVLKIIDDAREQLGIADYDFNRKAGFPVGYWATIKRGKRRITLDNLPNLARTAGLSFQVVAPHHEPFLVLTEQEAKDLIRLAEHYKIQGPKQPHPLRSAVEKLTQ